MVLYHASGRVVIAHENYLEQQARKAALDSGYVEQIDVWLHRRDTVASTQPVRIAIDAQRFKTLYCEQKDGSGEGSNWEHIDDFRQDATTIERDIDRDTLRRCSTLADEYFTYNPDSNRLNLPVRYARQHISNQGSMTPAVFQTQWPGRVYVPGKRHAHQTDSQMAFIRPTEIENCIIPWLERVQGALESAKKTKDKGKGKAKAKADASEDRPATNQTKDEPTNYLVRQGGPLEMDPTLYRQNWMERFIFIMRCSNSACPSSSNCRSSMQSFSKCIRGD
jgi:hypothetical protein